MCAWGKYAYFSVFYNVNESYVIWPGTLSNTEHKTKRICMATSEYQELLLSTVKHTKLLWFGHVWRHDALPKIILQGTVDCIGIAEEDLVIHERMERPVDDVTAAHRG